jgi:hypothetical protein
MIWSLLVAAGTWAQRLDSQLIHHVLMVLLGSERDRRWQGILGVRACQAPYDENHARRE